MLTNERPCRQHPDAAAVQLYGCVARHCQVVWHSLRALISCPQLAPSQPGTLQVLWVRVVGCTGCPEQVRKNKAGSEKTPPFTRLSGPLVRIGHSKADRRDLWARHADTHTHAETPRSRVHTMRRTPSDARFRSWCHARRGWCHGGLDWCCGLVSFW